MSRSFRLLSLLKYRMRLNSFNNHGTTLFFTWLLCAVLIVLCSQLIVDINFFDYVLLVFIGFLVVIVV